MKVGIHQAFYLEALLFVGRMWQPSRVIMENTGEKVGDRLDLTRLFFLENLVQSLKMLLTHSRASFIHNGFSLLQSCN